jgi:hypothetical protein
MSDTVDIYSVVNGPLPESAPRRVRPTPAAHKSMVDALPPAVSLMPRRGVAFRGLCARFGYVDDLNTQFSTSTDFGFRPGASAILIPLAFEHSAKNDRIGVARITNDPFGRGLMAEALVDMDSPFYEEFSKSYRPGDWGFSCGAEFEKRDASGVYTAFNLAELSITATPADPWLKALEWVRVVGEPEYPLWSTAAERQAIAVRFRQYGIENIRQAAVGI